MTLSATVADFLREVGVPFDLVRHGFAESSNRCAARAHVSGEAVAKSVLLEDGQGYLMAIIPATHRVDFSDIERYTHRRFTLASEHELGEIFHDCEYGAAPPLGDPYGVRVFYDDSLLDQRDIYFEAGDHLDLVHVRGPDFEALMSGNPHGNISYHS